MLHHLLAFLAQNRDISINDLGLPGNKSLLTAIQSRLCELGILDPLISGNIKTPFGPVGKGDGKLGINTRNALLAFHQLAKLPYAENQISYAALKLLAEVQSNVFLPLILTYSASDDPQTRLAKRILQYMTQKGYWIAKAPNMYNIVYIEGMNADGTANRDLPNRWNDRRMVIRILPGGQPKMEINDEATTEPGRYYTFHPLHRLGAARIAFGQYKAWVDGLHKGSQPALIQTGMIRLHRDLDFNQRRSPKDPIVIGDYFRINQHSTTPEFTPEFVDRFSAGCLVGRRFRWHLSFMHTVRQDFRYRTNKAYVFMTTVINGSELNKELPV